MRKAVLLVVGAVVFGCGGVSAGECIDEVSKLAGDLGISTELPQAQAQANGEGLESQQQPAAGTATTDDLARSGGVVAPPADAVSDMPVIKPPATGDAMPTAPKLAPQANGETGGVASEAANKAQIQSLLVAASQAARSGDTQGCLDQLQKARALLAAAQQ